MFTLAFVGMIVLALIFWSAIWRLASKLVDIIFKFERE